MSHPTLWFRCAAVILTLVLGVPHAAADGTDAVFPDMATSWYGYRDAVSYLIGKGSIEGYPDGTFKPRQTVNRAEFLKLVFRSRSFSDPGAGRCFSDFNPDAWFAPFVCAAKRRGIVQGYPLGSRQVFRPEQPIIFAEAIKMVLLAYGSDVKEGTGEHWYQTYVDRLDHLKILPGSSYNPGDPITRERAADLIARYVRHEEERIIARHSPGCGKSERSPSLLLRIDDQERSYLLDVPAAHDSTTPSPLVVAFHGRTNANTQVRGYFGLDRAATRYFVAYPAGVDNGNGTYSWSDPGDKASELRDIAFFDAIVKEVGESYCIDLDRIYVVGHSLGAWFANAVACARGGVVRGSATVGGAIVTNGCTGPSAAFILNNPEDTLSPHANAEKMRDMRVAANNCGGAYNATEPSAFSCVSFEDRCDRNPVVFCPSTFSQDHKGGHYPHVWPPQVAEAMVDFFDGL